MAVQPPFKSRSSASVGKPVLNLTDYPVGIPLTRVSHEAFALQVKRMKLL
jgi:hypothetical protein